MTQSDAGVASLTPTKITPAELDAFSAAQVQGSFQQTSQMAAMGAFNGPVDYVGVKRGDKLIAACYVVYTQSRFGLEGSVWCGPLCDYDNPQVVEAMTEALRRSAKAHHAISVSCWPARNGSASPACRSNSARRMRTTITTSATRSKRGILIWPPR